MNDYTKLSDDELKAAYAATQQPAKPFSAMSDDELKAAYDQATGAVTSMGLLKSAGTGLTKFVAAAAGAPLAPLETTAEWARKGGVAAAKGLGGNVPEWLDQPIPTTSERLIKGVEQLAGPLYKPQNKPERYVETVAEMVPGALVGGRGNVARKVLQQGVIPGVTSEYLGQQAEGKWYETPARIAGAVIGGLGGAAGGKAYDAAKSRIATGSAARDLGVSAPAARRVAENVADDQLTPQSTAAKQAELGDEAMLLDMGRQLRGRAEAIATQPGRGQNKLLDAVEGRTGRFGAGTAQRVEQTLDQEMGPTHNVVDLIDRVNTVVDRVAGPKYKAVMAAHPVLWNAELQTLAQRPAIRSAIDTAETLAANYGEKIDMTALPSLKAWDYVKKNLDRRINNYMKSGGASDLNSADKADLGGLMDARKALVSTLDRLTKGEYKDARQASATKFELKEGLEFGRSAFNTNLLPEEFAAELAQMSAGERAMAKAGFRRELDKLIENTRNSGATARRVLDTNSVRQKIETLFGPQAAKEIERRIGAENTFQEATQDIARNSRTAVRQELQKDTATPSSSEIRGASITGLGLAGIRGGLNYLRDQGTRTTREQIADLLTRGGPDIGPTVERLNRLNQRRSQIAQPTGDPRTAIVNALIAAQQQ